MNTETETRTIPWNIVIAVICFVAVWLWGLLPFFMISLLNLAFGTEIPVNPVSLTQGCIILLLLAFVNTWFFRILTKFVELSAK